MGSTLTLRETEDRCPWVYTKHADEIEESKDYCKFSDEICVRVSGQECAIYDEWLEEEKNINE